MSTRPSQFTRSDCNASFAISHEPHTLSLMDAKQPAVYILASGRNGTLYTGVTGNLVQRAWQHREHVGSAFTTKYGVRVLVWYELHGDMEHAIRREKQLKRWNRLWKLRLIEERNADWRDLWNEVIGAMP